MRVPLIVEQNRRWHEYDGCIICNMCVMLIAVILMILNNAGIYLHCARSRASSLVFQIAKQNSVAEASTT
jgi:hypothetical protein